MSDSIHVRNALALDARNKALTAEVDTLRERVRHLENQTAMVVTTVAGLEQRIIATLASRGTGPTQR